MSDFQAFLFACLNFRHRAKSDRRNSGKDGVFSEHRNERRKQSGSRKESDDHEAVEDGTANVQFAGGMPDIGWIDPVDLAGHYDQCCMQSRRNFAFALRHCKADWIFYKGSVSVGISV